MIFGNILSYLEIFDVYMYTYIYICIYIYIYIIWQTSKTRDKTFLSDSCKSRDALSNVVRSQSRKLKCEFVRTKTRKLTMQTRKQTRKQNRKQNTGMNHCGRGRHMACRPLNTWDCLQQNCGLLRYGDLALSVCLPVSLPACMPACLPVCLSDCLSVCVCLSKSRKNLSENP